MSHICIIEDDAAIAEIERDYLEINGFTVSIATDGVSGLNLTQKESFDLILLDLMLPQLDGFTLCRKLRERLDIPILMVTAKKEDIDKIRGLGLGADDYIVKPFSPSELVARVQAHIATYKRLKAPQEIQQDITVGAIRICPKSHRVFVQEQEINLKNKEYELREEQHEVAGMLLYAKTEEEIQPDQKYKMSGNRISVRTLDLNLDFSEIRKQLDGIVEEYFEEAV